MSYLHFIWRSHRKFLLFSMITIALFQFLLLKLVTAVDYSSIIMYGVEQLPEGVRALFGDSFISMLTVEGAAAFGLNHPFVLVILSIGAIAIPSRHIAGEIETGTLELVLSFPVERIRLLLNLILSAVVFLFIIIVFALCSSLLSIHLFHRLTVDLFVKMVQIGCNLWLLFIFIMSLALVFSCFEKEGTKVSIRVAGILLVFYLVHYLSALWDAIQFTIPINIFTYYQPEDLMSGQRPFWLHFVVLIALILICLMVSMVKFQRRDIPG